MLNSLKVTMVGLQLGGRPRVSDMASWRRDLQTMLLAYGRMDIRPCKDVWIQDPASGTCSHFVDPLCLEQAVYATHAKELYREVTLDGKSIETLWKGCGLNDDDELPDQSVLDLLSDEKPTPLGHISISYLSAVRKLLLMGHCSSLYLRTGHAADWHPASVPRHLSTLTEELGISALFCDVENLVIGEEYMEYILKALENDTGSETSLGINSKYIPQYVPIVCIHWPDYSRSEMLGDELKTLITSPSPLLACYELVIHNAKLDQIPPILGPELVLDLAPAVYHEGVDCEYHIGHTQEVACLRWLSRYLKDVARVDYRGQLDITFANLFTWKPSTPNSVLRYNTDVELGGDSWHDDTAEVIDDTAEVIDDAACGFSDEEQMVLEDFFPRDMGPRHCPCCAPFVPRGEVDLWHYVGAKNKKGKVYDRVSKENVYDRIFRDFGL
ncbi:hypothetical protein, variant [Cryptococcus amylolentus CBS 6039]|uniref:Uncharacterized protein n=1 Tax=Cryptococcus amylolentus CBS 6039 TaxID=1295533 RepID=A0A1E3HPJ6_9TREE|nr:hypothetical protein, variant [Cryptococcus amylolentus CBS 6039]ODN77626.1 hypothetical protein, variant [Cryptococcus amylolentus CBS 6039]